MTQDEDNTPGATVRKALDAFREITGKDPEDAPNECSVFVKAAVAATHPNEERLKWIGDVRELNFADPRVRQLRMVEEVEMRAHNGYGEKGWKELRHNPEELRRMLEPFDARFLQLSDDGIREALTRSRVQLTAALAELMVSCGAFGHGIQKGETNLTARARVKGWLASYKQEFDPW